jgi:hypothetical protein
MSCHSRTAAIPGSSVGLTTGPYPFAIITFGALPNQIGEATKEQKDFLKQSVAGLAEEGKVICVRLALYAEMMKGKPWRTSTLKALGGTTRAIRLDGLFWSRALCVRFVR